MHADRFIKGIINNKQKGEVNDQILHVFLYWKNEAQLQHFLNGRIVPILPIFQ